MSKTNDETTNVAIACQGGGSHAAFTAGVLKGLLSEWRADHELVGLSGTSGGAVSALTAWYGLLADGETHAGELLESVWQDIAARSPSDRWLNEWVVSSSRLRNSGVPLPEVSPYGAPLAPVGQRRLRTVLDSHIDFEAIPALVTAESPRMVVGTVDINGGEFEVFVDEEITAEVMLASTALPVLFEAVYMNGHYHWDGLFSQNPPINDLMYVDAGKKPEELWVVQINPQATTGEPRSLEEIYNRRTELAGNLSLNQELRFIEQVNDWVDTGRLSEERFTRTTIRRIELNEELDRASKFDRTPRFVTDLMETGEQQASELLNAQY